MFWDNRNFATPEELKVPELDDNEVKLFKGLTQERADMLAQIKHEGEQRIKRDNELLEEMHSFGLIECKAADHDMKFFTIDLTEDASVNTWCYKIPLAGGSITQGNWGVKIWKNTLLNFYMTNEQRENNLRCAVAWIDRYKIRTDITDDGDMTFYLGTSGLMTDGTNLVTTLATTNNQITLVGKVTCYK